MTYAAADAIGLNYQTTSILTDSQVKAEQSPLISTVQSVSELKAAMLKMLDTMNAIIYIMIAGAVILTIVVLYNLGVLSFNERFRELSTLKVMGFSSKKLNRLIISQNMWLTVAGVIAGIPFGLIMVDFMMKQMTDSMDIMTVVSLLSYTICIVSTISVSLFVTFMLFKKTKNIDMVSALKSGE